VPNNTNIYIHRDRSIDSTMLNLIYDTDDNFFFKDDTDDNYLLYNCITKLIVGLKDITS